VLNPTTKFPSGKEKVEKPENPTTNMIVQKEPIVVREDKKPPRRVVFLISFLYLKS
jgi:hypothetical protein